MAVRVDIVSDSQSMIRRIQNGWLRHEWMEYIGGSYLRGLVWIYFPGHAGVRGNERADRLAAMGPAIGQLTMDRGDILHSLYTRRLDKDTEVDEVVGVRLREYGISKGDSRRGRLRGRSRKVYNQRATGTISIHTLRHLLNETELSWACPECLFN